MSILTTEEKKKMFQEFGGNETNTGSMEAQVAMITHRINHISGHLQTNKKDFSAQRALLTLVGKRKRFLRYITNQDINRYRSIIEKLGIRK